MIDLHIHSNFSDGAYNVDEILEIAQKIGCTTISIVDHNTCEAYEYLKNMKNRIFEGKIISGCEFNTFYNQILIELLGYDFNPELLKIELKKIYKYSPEELKYFEEEIFIEQCNKNHIKLALDIYQKDDNEHLSSYLYKCVKHYPENIKFFETSDDYNNPSVFYRKYMSNPNSVFFCNMEQFFPTPEEVADLIKKSGGKVFIPHIFEYGDRAKEILNGLLKTIYIDGIECFYSKFTVEQRNRISEFARENNLLISGGSDCHSGKHIKIGKGRGDLVIQPDMIGNWIQETNDFNMKGERNERQNIKVRNYR